MFDSVELVARVAVKTARDLIGNVANMAVKLVKGVAHALGEAASNAWRSIKGFGYEVALAPLGLMLGIGGGGSDFGKALKRLKQEAWIKELLVNRVIDAPTTLDESVVKMVKDYMVNDLGMPQKHVDDTATISILEVNDRWYLGLNHKTDEYLQSRFAYGAAKRPIPGLINPEQPAKTHVERRAIYEYIESGDTLPNNKGFLLVSREVCNMCVEDAPNPDYSGQIRDTVREAGLAQLTVTFRQNKVRSRFPQNGNTIVVKYPISEDGCLGQLEPQKQRVAS